MEGIRIDLEKAAYVLGEEVSGNAHVVLDVPVSQRNAMICLIGKDRTKVSYQAGRYRATAVEESEFLHQERPMNLPTSEKGKIMPGQFDIPFRFALPDGLPATYDGQHAKIQYVVAAKIDVPLGVDVGATSEFQVSSSSQPLRSRPINASSAYWNNPEMLGVNFTCERCEFCIGEVVSGKYVFRNPGSRNVRKVDVALRWIETATAKGHKATTEVMKQITKLLVGGRVANGESFFSIKIPQLAPLTFESSLSNVRCTLHVGLDIAWGSDVAADQAIQVVGSAGYRKELPPYAAERPSYAEKSIPGKPFQPAYAGRPTTSMRCNNCGAAIGTPDATYCPNCGSRLDTRAKRMTPPAIEPKMKIKKSLSPTVVGTEDCIVCRGELARGDDVVWCPHCGKLAHREHMMEWIRDKGTCPACGKSLNEEYYK